MNKPIDEELLAATDAEARWRREYSEQIGTDRQVANRSGVDIAPLYTQRDWDAAANTENLGFPGQRQFIRPRAVHGPRPRPPQQTKRLRIFGQQLASIHSHKLVGRTSRIQERPEQVEDRRNPSARQSPAHRPVHAKRRMVSRRKHKPQPVPVHALAQLRRHQIYLYPMA
jgi:hypothetical protein